MRFIAIGECFDYHNGTINAGSVWRIERTQVIFSDAKFTIKLRSNDGDLAAVCPEVIRVFFREYRKPTKYKNRKLI